MRDMAGLIHQSQVLHRRFTCHPRSGAVDDSAESALSPATNSAASDLQMPSDVTQPADIKGSSTVLAHHLLRECTCFMRTVCNAMPGGFTCRPRSPTQQRRCPQPLAAPPAPRPVGSAPWAAACQRTKGDGIGTYPMLVVLAFGVMYAWKPQQVDMCNASLHVTLGWV